MRVLTDGSATRGITSFVFDISVIMTNEYDVNTFVEVFHQKKDMAVEKKEETDENNHNHVRESGTIDLMSNQRILYGNEAFNGNTDNQASR